ncbi:hypothetical protein SAY86_014569 [Trapa natans]|uniref:B-like cyclin n=1 Tax=Trapa natans TaxID=22666 RepID=A0AAN7KUG5_TRANT|nr:hypothetical protein SAY86_014569 [Trapa natans]
MASHPEAVTGRVTRARAAALQMMAAAAAASNDSNAATMDEKNQNSAHPKGAQRKRKAVLQDVTNIRCKSYYKDCFKATKPLNGKQNHKSPTKLPTLMKRVSKGKSNSQGACKVKIATKESQEETCPRKIPQLKLDENVSSQLSKSEDALSLPQEEIKDIDAGKKNPLLCSIYARDIYDNLRFAELLRWPYHGYIEMVQRDITKGMRGILINWLVEVSEEYSLTSDTLYITVHLIDWFLSQNFIERSRLQLLGITCMLLASKYEEIYAPRVDELCAMTDNTYTREEVLRMEGQLLKYFRFSISIPTTKTFLRRFIFAAQATHTSPSLELEHLANYLAELTLIEYDFLNFLPSIIAASAIFLAKWTLDSSHQPWNPTLEYYTRYKVSDLKTTVFALQDLQLNKDCPLSAIRTKYMQQKFKCVAGMPSTKVLETLFLK